ncbi:WhiB family transcriptional regulator [Nocardioidaceae bacterium]|nr:WhiB family transcriptional regulator [Nocardioidaceae bacterium]
MTNESWAVSAACRQATAEELFSRGARQQRAKQICGRCTVRVECLAEALDNGIEWGVWGGMTERERRQLLADRPDVTSWRDRVDTALRAYEDQLSARAAGV